MEYKVQKKTVKGKTQYVFSTADENTAATLQRILNGFHKQPNITPPNTQPSVVRSSHASHKSMEAKLWRCMAYPDPIRKIAAIRAFRECTSYGLADSKFWVEKSLDLPLEDHEVSWLFQRDFVLIYVGDQQK